MNKIALAPKNERKCIFIEAAKRAGFNNYIIEKNFWVFWVLERIFNDFSLSEILCYKGDRSLSEAFGVIDRFSQDIDLFFSMDNIVKHFKKIINYSDAGQIGSDMEIKDWENNYIVLELFKDIRYLLANTCLIFPDLNNSHTFYIKYPQVFDYHLIKPEIKLEIKLLSLLPPNDLFPISSFVEKALPELNLKKPLVRMIKPE